MASGNTISLVIIMMRKVKSLILFFIGVFLLSNTLFTQNVLWSVTNTKVVFKIKNAKLNVEGTFNGVMAKVDFNPLNLAQSKFESSILTSTIKTGIEMRDKHLKRAEYFNVEKFPDITMKTVSISKTAENTFLAKCLLTIKGKTKEVNLPFTFNESKGAAQFKGNLSINRLDFGIGSPSLLMSNKLEVLITVDAIKAS
jgi:polyisoprenoid-binding protein YceI